MSAIVEAIGDAFSALVSVATSFVKDVWDAVAMPILEEVFSWFGIVDEEVVQVQSVTSLLFGNSLNSRKDALNRAVLSSVKNEKGMLYNIFKEYHEPSVRIDSYQRYGETKYIHSLPNASVVGTAVDKVPVKAAIDAETSLNNTILEADSTFPDSNVYIKHELQSLHDYKPYSNTLTFTDSNGLTHTDYFLNSINYNAVNNNYEVLIERNALAAKISIISDSAAVEGGNASITVQSSLEVPLGGSIEVNLAYSGTAIEGEDYTATPSITIIEGTSENTIQIPILDNVSTTNRTLIISIDSIIDTNLVFEHVVADINKDTTTTTLGDNDTPNLVISDVTVDESAGSAVFNVTLTKEVLNPFTVDYSLTDITALGGIDYDNTGGTLNFSGTLNEVQTVTVPITVDVENDDYETFKLSLSNISDTSVLIINEAIGTIRDFTDFIPQTVLDQQTIIRPAYTVEETVVAKYYNTVETEWYYWLYPISLGTYPDVKAVSVEKTNLEMLPIAIIRNNGISITEDTTTEAYKTTKKLLAKLALNVEDIVEAVENNPDINLIKNAFIAFAINPTRTENIVSKVLYKMFSAIVTDNSADTGVDKYSTSVEVDVVKSSVVWTEQSTNIVNGSIGNEGTYQHEVVGADLFMRKQINASQYHEIIIKNVNSIEFITSGGFFETSASKLGESNFKIFLSYYMVNDLRRIEQLELYPLSLSLTVQAVQITELEWYETEAFWGFVGDVLLIATIAIFITTGVTLGFDVAFQNLFLNAAISAVAIALALEIDSDLGKIVVLAASLYIMKSNVQGSAFDMLSPEALTSLSTNYVDILVEEETEEMKETEEKFNLLDKKYEERVNEFKEYDVFDNNASIIAYVDSPSKVKDISIKAQYDFSLIYNYDTLVKNFNKNRVKNV